MSFDFHNQYVPISLVTTVGAIKLVEFNYTVGYFFFKEIMRSINVAFWITLIRATLALSLGVALLVQPEKARPVLANFMGIYWLLSGVLSLRWGLRGERARGLPLLAGVIGILAGLSMLGRFGIRHIIAEEIFIYILGTVIVITGLLHMFGGFRTGEERRRERSWLGVLLGIFEVVLGVLLVLVPLDQGSIVYYAASIWALLGGLILLSDALAVRRRHAQAVDQE